MKQTGEQDSILAKARVSPCEPSLKLGDTAAPFIPCEPNVVRVPTSRCEPCEPIRLTVSRSLREPAFITVSRCTCEPKQTTAPDEASEPSLQNGSGYAAQMRSGYAAQMRSGYAAQMRSGYRTLPVAPELTREPRSKIAPWHVERAVAKNGTDYEMRAAGIRQAPTE